MAVGFRVTINPKLLEWARESSNMQLDVAAKKIGVKVEALSNWESGDQNPTITQLRKASKVYKRSTAVFYLKDVPKEKSAVKDYRLISRNMEPTIPPELTVEIRKALVRREAAIDLSEELGEANSPFTIKTSVNANANRVAETCRNALGITISQQLNWKNFREAYNNWRYALEQIGILVFQASRIPVPLMRGFSISNEIFPIIVVNSADSVNARSFTLMHELGHILLRHGGLCNFREVHQRGTDIDKAEVFCNYLSGSILVPEENLLAQGIVKNRSQREKWRDDEIEDLANTFKVSKHVILRRLLTTELITRAFYAERVSKYEKAPMYLEKKRKGRPSQAVLTVASNGRSFTRLVLTAYYRNAITASEVSNYLQVKLKHLATIEKNLGYRS